MNVGPQRCLEMLIKLKQFEYFSVFNPINTGCSEDDKCVQILGWVSFKYYISVPSLNYNSTFGGFIKSKPVEWKSPKHKPEICDVSSCAD